MSTTARVRGFVLGLASWPAAAITLGAAVGPVRTRLPATAAGTESRRETVLRPLPPSSRGA